MFNVWLTTQPGNLGSNITFQRPIQRLRTHLVSRSYTVLSDAYGFSGPMQYLELHVVPLTNVVLDNSFDFIAQYNTWYRLHIISPTNPVLCEPTINEQPHWSATLPHKSPNVANAQVNGSLNSIQWFYFDKIMISSTLSKLSWINANLPCC